MHAAIIINNKNKENKFEISLLKPLYLSLVILI